MTTNGFTLRDPFPWATFSSLAREGASLGYAALFLPEVGGRDTIAALTGLAGEAPSLRLGTGVIPLPSRPRMLLAMAAATAQERSGGRFILGLGTGPSRPGALERLRVEVPALRALLSGEPIEDQDGRVNRLAFLPATPPPIWIAALGPRAARLAGEVADGVILNWCPPERVAKARLEVAEGAESAGRDPAAVTISVYVRACVEQDREEASAALSAAAGSYAGYPAYARQFADWGLSGATPSEVGEVLCLQGNASDALARIEDFRAAGADMPVVYPVPAGSDPAASVLATLRAMAPGSPAGEPS